MSVVAEPPGGSPPPSESPLLEDVCAHCGSALAEDQEWCLECGAARTLIHRPPDWRIPLAVIGLVVLLVLAGFGIALVSLSGNANRSAQVQSAELAATPVSTPAKTTPAPTPPSATIASWPTGLSGWTVVLGRRRHRADAATAAQRIAATGTQVGVLDSSQHPSMTPGYWVIFSGRYPDLAAANAAARTLRSHGRNTATAHRVAPPGGI